MVFKRRDKLKPLTWLAQTIWPKGGWQRAARYLSYRLQRLPDTPVRISRGIFIGTVIGFSPFLGLHFVLAATLSYFFRANILAAILATCVSNPLSYVPITLISVKLGDVLLGERYIPRHEEFFGMSFVNATRDLFGNMMALLTGQPQDWSRSHVFWHDIFLPYMVGGLTIGFIVAIAAYHLTLPVITAYQRRRRGRLKAHLRGLRDKAKTLKESQAESLSASDAQGKKAE